MLVDSPVGRPGLVSSALHGGNAMSHGTEPASREMASRQRRRVEGERFKVVSTRLRSAEYESFSRQARLLGLTDSMAIRVAVRRIGGFLEIDAGTRR